MRRTASCRDDPRSTATQLLDDLLADRDGRVEDATGIAADIAELPTPQC